VLEAHRRLATGFAHWYLHKFVESYFMNTLPVLTGIRRQIGQPFTAGYGIGESFLVRFNVLFYGFSHRCFLGLLALIFVYIPMGFATGIRKFQSFHALEGRRASLMRLFNQRT
jgi:hypothetical protein